MKRIFSFLGGPPAGAQVLAVACMVARLTEAAAPVVVDVDANGGGAPGDAGVPPDNSVESA